MSVTFSGSGELTQAIVNASLGSATSVIISGYSSIGSSAFQNKSQITSITIPNSVTTIGNFAFQVCSGLTSITIPNSVTSIGEHAFEVCTGLTSVTIPDSVQTIGEYAFSGCTAVTSVILYSYISNVGYVFFGLNNANMSWTFDYSGAIPEGACNGKSLMTSVTIGNQITSIDDGAFKTCTSLTSVIIPTSVTSIASNAFTDSGLTTVTIANGQVISGTTFASPATNVSFFGATVNTINTQTFYTVMGIDLINIFAPYISGTQASATGYKVSNGADLNTIFAALPNSTSPGVQTSYYVTGQGDLGNIFYTKIPFLIQGSNNYIRGTLSNYYNVLYFRPGTFTVTPLINVNIYQLFVVASGSTGIGRNGGNGGQVLFNQNTTIGANPFAITPSDVISLTVAAAYNPSTPYTVTNTGNNSNASIPSLSINYTALGGNGAAGGSNTSGIINATNGTQNIYTGLYYGGGGGPSGGAKQPGLPGGLGGGGGGGGSYNGQSSNVGYNGAAGGGISVDISGGAGGLGATSNPSSGGTGTSSQFGGGGGGGSWGSIKGANGGTGGQGGGAAGLGGGPYSFYGGSGGGGGGGGYYGGGGGAGGQGGGTGLAQADGGGGGAGVILLIYKIE